MYKNINECKSGLTKITVNNERCFTTSLQFESFCEKLIDVLSGINKQQPTCSILVGDFNAELSI